MRTLYYKKKSALYFAALTEHLQKSAVHQTTKETLKPKQHCAHNAIDLN